ncbi:MAG: cation-transporting P-type ATPase, partial [Thermodesulfobacteriota bacterium]
ATSRKGLTSSVAAERLVLDGRNRLESAPPPSLLTIFINQFKDFIIYILLFAILLLNGLIGFFQELSANRSLEPYKK